MKRRLLILFTLVALLVVLRTGEVVRADACTNCGTVYASCTDDAASNFEVCLDLYAQGVYDVCIYNGGMEATCQQDRANAIDECQNNYNELTNMCQANFNSCVASNCSNGGYGGSATFSCEPPAVGNGYSASGVALYAGLLDSCVASGADAFNGWNVDTSGYTNCMAGTGDPNLCCRGQISLIIQARCGCNRDPRNSDCKTCYSF